MSNNKDEDGAGRERSLSVRLSGEKLERFEEIEREKGTQADTVRFLIDAFGEQRDRIAELEEERDSWREDVDGWREMALSLKEKYIEE